MAATRPRPAYANRTRASLSLIAFVVVLFGAFAGFIAFANAQPSSGWENSDPIANWHLPSHDNYVPAGYTTP